MIEEEEEVVEKKNRYIRGLLRAMWEYTKEWNIAKDLEPKWSRSRKTFHFFKRKLRAWNKAVQVNPTKTVFHKVWHFLVKVNEEAARKAEKGVSRLDFLWIVGPMGLWAGIFICFPFWCYCLWMHFNFYHRYPWVVHFPPYWFEEITLLVEPLYKSFDSFVNFAGYSNKMVYVCYWYDPIYGYLPIEHVYRNDGYPIWETYPYFFIICYITLRWWTATLYWHNKVRLTIWNSRPYAWYWTMRGNRGLAFRIKWKKVAIDAYYAFENWAYIQVWSQTARNYEKRAQETTTRYPAHAKLEARDYWDRVKRRKQHNKIHPLSFFVNMRALKRVWDRMFDKKLHKFKFKPWVAEKSKWQLRAEQLELVMKSGKKALTLTEWEQESVNWAKSEAGQFTIASAFLKEQEDAEKKQKQNTFIGKMTLGMVKLAPKQPQQGPLNWSGDSSPDNAAQLREFIQKHNISVDMRILERKKRVNIPKHLIEKTMRELARKQIARNKDKDEKKI